MLILLAASTAMGASASVSDDCPCKDSINKLISTYDTDARFRELLDAAFAHMQQTPPDYSARNPWIGKSFPDLVSFMEQWCTFLPKIHGSSDDGLKYIQEMALFYYDNPFGVAFVQLSPGRGIIEQFVRERGAYMDSPDSTKVIAEWLTDPRVEKEDYALPSPKAKDGGFKSYNEFFSRSLKNRKKSRPVTMPERDYVISAPTDCLMNSIPQYITDINTPISTKGTEALNIVDLLDGSGYAKKFVGGTALSCVLMPNTYHHYHAPVSGTMVEAKVVDGAFFGHPDFPKWAPSNGNVGAPGAEFSPFENFQRGYFIIDTGKYGHVAMVAVGLNTISSVVFKKPFDDLRKPVKVTRGDELGYFLYGGSLFMMIFEPDKYESGAVQVRLGNQIGVFDTTLNQ
jgi:phosphatidylserine decarboxylase